MNDELAAELLAELRAIRVALEHLVDREVKPEKPAKPQGPIRPKRSEKGAAAVKRMLRNTG